MKQTVTDTNIQGNTSSIVILKLFELCSPFQHLYGPYSQYLQTSSSKGKLMEETRSMISPGHPAVPRKRMTEW